MFVALRKKVIHVIQIWWYIGGMLDLRLEGA